MSKLLRNMLLLHWNCYETLQMVEALVLHHCRYWNFPISSIRYGMNDFRGLELLLNCAAVLMVLLNCSMFNRSMVLLNDTSQALWVRLSPMCHRQQRNKQELPRVLLHT
jgi:Flp pilus assembly protein TadB